MSLAIPVQQQLRRRPKPLNPYKATMVQTQYIRFEADQLRALEIELGASFSFVGSILGRPHNVTGECSHRSAHMAMQQAGHWQNDILANIDAAAKAMTQLQLPEQRWTWEWVGPEYVRMDVAILPIESAPPPPPEAHAAPQPRNRLRR